ncbi:ZBED8 (predicted) [Pycnogonum litorale]
MNLEEELDRYFPNIGEDEFVYLRNPFAANAQLVQPGTGMQDELVELQHDDSARDVYGEEQNLCDFWLQMRDSYRQIAERAIRSLLLFPSTWLCESTFSALLAIKTKHRSNQRTPEHDLRCAVSPRIHKLVAKKQSHDPSH